MNYKYFIIILFIMPFILNAQTDDFSWLIGRWQVQSLKANIYEEWQMDGQRLKGEGYKITNGKKSTTETLFLENFDGQWAYIALPVGQLIALFALVESENNRYVFVNKEHDFPQQIIYHFDGHKKIRVSVGAEEKGKNKKFELILIKVE